MFCCSGAHVRAAMLRYFIRVASVEEQRCMKAENGTQEGGARRTCGEKRAGCDNKMDTVWR